MSDDDDAVPIRCDSCSYEWEYTGDLYNTTCPRCNNKTSTPLEPDEEDGLDALRERRAALIADLSEVQAQIEHRR